MASKLLDEALTISRQTGTKREIAWNLLSLGGNQTSLGELDRAEANLLESLEVGRQSDDATAAIAALGALGRIYWLQGNPARARGQYEQALTLARELNMTWGIGILCISLGDIALADGDRLTAFKWYRQGLEKLKLQATPARMAHALRHYAGLQCASGDYRGAVRILAAASRVQNATGLALTALPVGEADLIASARQTLPAHEFSRAWAEGLMLTLDGAIDEVLSAPPPDALRRPANQRIRSSD